MSTVFILRAFLRRDWETDISYRAAFGIQLAGTLLTLALFFYLGRIVDDSDVASLQGTSGGYFGYVAVGLGVFVIVQLSLNSFSHKFRDEQLTGTLEAMMATPASPSQIILSSAAYDLLRGTVDGFLLIVTAVVVFGLRLETDPAGLAAALAAVVGCIGLFASLGVVVAASTMLFKKTAGLLAFIGPGLALLGGVYYPIDVLPAPLEAIARILPLTWGLEVVRAGLLGGDVDPLQLAALLLSVVVAIPLALMLFRASLWRARRLGTLAQY